MKFTNANTACRPWKHNYLSFFFFFFEKRTNKNKQVLCVSDKVRLSCAFSSSEVWQGITKWSAGGRVLSVSWPASSRHSLWPLALSACGYELMIEAAKWDMIRFECSGACVLVSACQCWQTRPSRAMFPDAVACCIFLGKLQKTLLQGLLLESLIK